MLAAVRFYSRPFVIVIVLILKEVTKDESPKYVATATANALNKTCF